MIQPYAVYKRLTLEPKTNRLKAKKGGKLFHAYSNQKRAVMSIQYQTKDFYIQKDYK